MRTLETIMTSLVGKLHRGFALRIRGGVLDAVLGHPRGEIARIEEDAAAMMDEVDPRTAGQMLVDFERVLGPDPCGRDMQGLSSRQRQMIAHQRWTATGGQSIPYFMSILARLGHDAQIEEFWPSTCGHAQAGDELVPEGEQFVWLVRLRAIDETVAEAGLSQSGDLLVAYTFPDAECELRRLKPAHTTLVVANTLQEAA
ncbi:MAG: DUF2313 domain-containing protein [Ahrensia sp.]|nr:DUF2313 domain-containing protein [Ahrensia sp.]